jgi:hypothetical protein
MSKRLNTVYKVTTRTTPPQTAEEHERMRLAANILVKWLCLKDEEFKNYNESGCSIDEFYQTLAYRKSQKRKAKRIESMLQEEQLSGKTYIS